MLSVKNKILLYATLLNADVENGTVNVRFVTSNIFYNNFKQDINIFPLNWKKMYKKQWTV